MCGQAERVLRMSVWVSKVCLPSITPSLYLSLSQTVQVNETGYSDELRRDDITLKRMQQCLQYSPFLDDLIFVIPPAVCCIGLDVVSY